MASRAAPNSIARTFIWLLVAAAGALSLGIVALQRGESVNALWIVVAAICVYLVAFRFYALFIARRVLGIDPERRTPAVRRNDGLDYVPTNRYYLFGHHFAAIAGAGPLVGPVLAAQMGYLPSTLWLLVGVVFAGAVQDFVVLFISTRRDGRSLGELIRTEIGHVPGIIGMVGILAIMIILLAVLALIIVKALAQSPWGTFTVFATIPLAMIMGIYGRYIRPGRIGEISLIGFVGLILAILLGESVAFSPTWGPAFTFSGEALALMLIAYGFIASVLPVWLLLAPRDYLSTFLKIGTVVALAIGILIVMPELKMPAVTRFVDGTGPVFAGSLFPFLFITIACGAVSGFHSLVASGTTPKMVESEAHLPMIGYGAMLMESFVAIMALVAASILDPGVYFALNSPPAAIGATAAQAATTISSWGFTVTPAMLDQVASQVGEATILSRTGGAPTLAVGMANILSSVIGGPAMMAFWYHFAILFEALFILTTIDAGTRVARFMIQDFLGTFIAPFKEIRSWTGNLVATALAVGGWGWFLYQGVTDPLGGINTLWPLFGIANQMLAAIALVMCSVVLFRMKKENFAWVTLLPLAWLLVCTLTAGWQKMFHPDPKIGFLSHAAQYSQALATGQVLAPARGIAQMRQIIFNDAVNATLCALFMAVVLAMVFYGLRAILSARRSEAPTTREVADALA
jgi:carbon starvation protein